MTLPPGHCPDGRLWRAGRSEPAGVTSPAKWPVSAWGEDSEAALEAGGFAETQAEVGGRHGGGR